MALPPVTTITRLTPMASHTLDPMFQVLRSSAGAGKTHALVKHYLGLCMRSEDPGAYRQVLALTFTNKAAQEMRDRAVRYLRNLATQGAPDAAMQDVLHHLETLTALRGEALALRADRLLRHMLHHWSEVAISTIDAFTQRVVRPFARELQLDHELRMSTDQEGYLQQAVERLIALAGEDPRVTDILGQACLQLLHDEQRWDPERPLVQLSRELQNERSIKPLQRIAALDIADVRRISQQLRDQQQAFRAQVRSLGQEALTTLQNAGITAADLHQTTRGIHGFFVKLAAFDTAAVELNSYARATVETGKWAGPRISAAANDALEAAVPRLEQCVQQALDLLERGYRDHLLRAAILRDLPATFALHELERQLEAAKQEDGIAFFSDLTRRVAEIVANEPVPFIHERMGERYLHFLIDEFQDTSLLQWTCLLPLVDNALANGGSALLVGDAKQAIYRWRNGEVRLFTELPKLFGRTADPLDEEREETLIRHYAPLPALAHNRRSSPIIIGFNNELFGVLAATLPQSLRVVYQAHEQLPGKERPGLVEVRVLDGTKRGEERWDEVLLSVDESLQQALADGARPGDVAVLVRTGAQGARIAQHLIEQGISVLSPDGLKVAVDRRVALVLDALRAIFLHDPAAAMRALYAQALVLHQDTGTVDPFLQRGAPFDALDELHRTLDPLPLNEQLDTLPEVLRYVHHRLLPGAPPQAPFLALLDEAHGWSLDNAPDVPAFLRHWDRNGAARSTAPPDDGNAVHVMTIHKAKGLEFPVVIVPEVTMRTGGPNTERIWVTPGSALPELDAALVAYGSALRDAGVPELQQEEELRQLDDLNLLYVAFTRPVDRLYAFVRGNATDAVGRGLLEWMEQQNAGSHLLRGERAPLKGHQHQPAQATLKEVRGPGASVPVQLRVDKDVRLSPAVERGRKLHAVLARVTHAEQLKDALEKALHAGEIDTTDRDVLFEELAAKLSAPQLAPWYAATGTVITEANLVDEQGKAWRPDRVVIGPDAVRVLDLKTGDPREEHHHQVEHYLQLLRAMGHHHVEGALYYLTQDELVPV